MTKEEERERERECVCVCESQHERQRERESGKERGRGRDGWRAGFMSWRRSVREAFITSSLIQSQLLKDGDRKRGREGGRE